MHNKPASFAMPKRTVRLLCVALCLAAWGYKAEATMGLGLVGLAMKGTISGPSSQPVEFKRTGEAKVELVSASPAVSKALEGDWEGSLKTPSGPARMVFHFKNQPDQTATATFDSGNDVGLPLKNVKQTGQKVEFAVVVGFSAFQGSLNQAGTELAGQFIAGPTSMPLTLRKK